MTSRLLDRLEARIAETRDPARRACWRAQRAIYLARQGSHDAVQAEVQAIREAFGARPQAEVTAWVSLAEAVNSFYSHPGPAALDRLKRAQALARAIGHVELQALCAAWLAHLEFNANRMETMVQHAAEALRLAEPDHHAALARASLVVADAYHFAGRFDLAKDWYAAVRQHALADGDDAMISAMLHNVAALRVNRVHLADAFGDNCAGELQRAQMETDSVESYDFGIGTLSLKSFVPLLRAQLLTVQRRFEEALSILDAASEESDYLPRREAQFRAERAWCQVNLGDSVQAELDIEHSRRCLATASDADDLAATHSRVASTLKALGRSESAMEYEQQARLELQRYRTEQAALLALLELHFPKASLVDGLGRR
jgi:tetratricopeptide (TPR) repeat protein